MRNQAASTYHLQLLGTTLALLLLLLLSACTAQPQPKLLPGTHRFHRYVALGDSYSAGEGLEPYQEGSDTEHDRCHRSDNAYAIYVAAKHRVFVACSQVTTDAYWHRGSEPAQNVAL